MESDKKYALVTGASSGLGAVFARKLAARGYHLYLAARRQERLEKAKEELEKEYQVEVHPIPVDLTDPSDRDALFEATGGVNSQVDLLINNAGIGFLKPFVDYDYQRCHQMMALNVNAVIDLTYRYLPGMVKRGYGDVIIVSSTASFQPLPYFSLYAATKGFERQFAEGLYYEVRKEGVHVLTLCPGPTKTEFGEANGMDINDVPFGYMEADPVVEAALRGMDKKKRVVIPGFTNRLGVVLQGFLPQEVVNWMSHLIFKGLNKKVNG